jgi:hypothetical protein
VLAVRAVSRFMSLCRQVTTKLAADRIGLDHRRLVHEHHSVWSLSCQAIAYPDPGTTLPQVPGSHDVDPDPTRPCRLRSAQVRMSEVRARSMGAG